MLSVRTVLCPVDFSVATSRQVELAVDICRAFGARLVLHHNVFEVPSGSGVNWMWATDHGDSERAAEQKLLELVNRVPEGTTADIRLTRGPVGDGVLTVGRAVAADLVVLSTRGATSEVDGSVTERVLERATLPVFAIHQALHSEAMPKFRTASTERQTLLVPTDLTPASQRVLGVAFELARRFPFDLHLLHVVPGRTDGSATEHARSQMAAMVPSDLPHRPHQHFESGQPAEVIARVAAQLSAAFIVMGEHARTPMRHWLRPDTAKGVLHSAHCPIWYVPGPPTRKELLEGERQPEPAHEPPASLVDELRNTRFRYWPTSQLYGVVDSHADAESALAGLLAAGVPSEHLQTWHGPSGKQTIDPTGESHSAIARLWRTLEKATPERQLLDQYGAEVERGHVLIGVRCSSGDGRKVIAGILQQHGGRLLSYFAIGSVERLSP
jgi:nucleotide-binding universal stress UspA family protein